MFHLESSIATWRQQMLVAGVQTPATLDELECHLREEIRRQMDSGLDEGAAFAFAVDQIGSPQILKTEFRRARGALGWLGEDRQTRTLRVLSLLWLVYCAGGVILELSSYLLMILYGTRYRHAWEFYLPPPLALIYLRGTIASLRLFGGNLKEQRILWLIAILDAACGIGIRFNHPIGWLSWLFVLLGITSIWLLRPTRKTGLAH